MGDCQEFVIEKGVPLPNQGRISKYPWSGMQIGDSFLVPEKLEQRLRAAAWSRQQSRPGEKYSVRKDKDNGEVRVWRVA